MHGKDRCLKLLLGAGANMNTTLIVAALNGKTACAKLLLEAGANLAAKDKVRGTEKGVLSAAWWVTDRVWPR